MALSLHTIGKRIPDWVQSGVQDYTRRYPRHWRFALHEYAPSSAANADERKQREARSLQRAIPEQAHLVALDVQGSAWSTESLADQVGRWEAMGKPVCLLIGGADGLQPALLGNVAQRWSLSPLTFPHTLARLIVAEQLYRAYTLSQNHPYHRA